MKKIISNLSVMIFVIGCVIMEITTWFIDSYVMFYIGIIIVIVGTIGMIIQGKFKNCLLYTSPSPRDVEESRMPSSA